MLLRCLPMTISALAASMLLPALAQPVVPAASAPASGPRATQAAPPRLSTPVEQSEQSAMPGDLRPEERVTPQIVVPLRKGSPPAKAPQDAAAQRAASSPGSIDDTVARCEAEKKKMVRDKCLSTATQ